MPVPYKRPGLLNDEIFRQEWEPEGWNLLVIGPTATWRRDWGMWEAIRDVVQNALDETESYSYGYDEHGLWIADSGSGMNVSDLLLGPGIPKPDYSRGRFGEGMKVAALTMLRNSYDVYVETIGKEVFMTFYEQKTNGHTQVLAAIWRSGGSAIGTIFHVIGYFGPAYEENFTINLPTSAIVAEGPAVLTSPTPRKNQIIDYRFPDGKNKIFARDIFMRNISSPFSYNLWDFELAPDRHAASDPQDVYGSMSRVWCSATDINIIKTFLEMVVNPPILESEEGGHFQFWAYMLEKSSGVDCVGYINIVKDNAAIWKQAWDDVFGEMAVRQTRMELDNTMRHYGYRPIVVSYNTAELFNAMGAPVDTAIMRAVRDKMLDFEVIEDHMLSPTEIAHMSLARRLTHAANCNSTVNAAMIPAISGRTSTSGMYVKALDHILLDRTMLTSASKVVNTLDHEVAHAITGSAEDGSVRHNEAMSRVAGMFVKAIAEGSIPSDLLADCYW